MASAVCSPFNSNLHDAIQNCKVLVVGAGGIGCEILKNLVLSDFKYIEIIDLDTIDVSNLNRQFLFQKEHVGKSKAIVAQKTALSFNPKVEIIAHHDSITGSKYGVNFFARFNIVLNALDNRQARNHVNRMCLTANVPLIESGTSGYNGQVELIKKGLTLCYECSMKSPEKTYPGCTIRNTPSEPIHCIVWAKHLFNQLFGEQNADEDVSPDTAYSKQASENDGNLHRVSTRAWAEECNYDVQKLFKKLFCDDIKYLLTMDKLWAARQPPKPLELDGIIAAGNSQLLIGMDRDTQIWDLAESVKIFSDSIDKLQDAITKIKKTNKEEHLVWDKDDISSMDFVASCSNIRSEIFGIPRKSRFVIKSMAGNIIPAIATTNAVTAGLVVLHAYKVIQNQLDKCQSLYVRSRPNGRNQIIVPEKILVPPNPKCYVCSEKNEVALVIDTKKITIKSFRDDVLIKTLNMVNPDCMIDGKGIIVISSEEGETGDCNDKFLHEMSINDGCILKVDDFFQNYELTIVISHFDADGEDVLFKVVSDNTKLVLKPSNKNSSEISQTNGLSKVLKTVQTDAESKSIEIESSNDAEKIDKPDKDTSEDDGPSSKRKKVNDTDDDDFLQVVEDATI